MDHIIPPLRSCCSVLKSTCTSLDECYISGTKLRCSFDRIPLSKEDTKNSSAPSSTRADGLVVHVGEPWRSLSCGVTPLELCACICCCPCCCPSLLFRESSDLCCHRCQETSISRPNSSLTCTRCIFSALFCCPCRCCCPECVFRCEKYGCISCLSSFPSLGQPPHSDYDRAQGSHISRRRVYSMQSYEYIALDADLEDEQAKCHVEKDTRRPHGSPSHFTRDRNESYRQYDLPTSLSGFADHRSLEDDSERRIPLESNHEALKNALELWMRELSVDATCIRTPTMEIVTHGGSLVADVPCCTIVVAGDRSAQIFLPPLSRSIFGICGPIGCCCSSHRSYPQFLERNFKIDLVREACVETRACETVFAAQEDQFFLHKHRLVLVDRLGRTHVVSSEVDSKLSVELVARNINEFLEDYCIPFYEVGNVSLYDPHSGTGSENYMTSPHNQNFHEPSSKPVPNSGFG